ncbi:hypothetical protein CALCODRAFT_37725 [Calocera cornea HHB12733]|uniref:Uncharacterized protein n=1 Tax=Calocera cornea HHB12733 TaxID=1353952 RepID=A0A165DY11_9BASI|nr:hypothetical protein CALCODRAFT_37725 [Calocera cornea HHB12733]
MCLLRVRLTLAVLPYREELLYLRYVSPPCANTYCIDDALLLGTYGLGNIPPADISELPQIPSHRPSAQNVPHMEHILCIRTALVTADTSPLYSPCLTSGARMTWPSSDTGLIWSSADACGPHHVSVDHRSAVYIWSIIDRPFYGNTAPSATCIYAAR